MEFVFINQESCDQQTVLLFNSQEIQECVSGQGKKRLHGIKLPPSPKISPTHRYVVRLEFHGLKEGGQFMPPSAWQGLNGIRWSRIAPEGGI